MSKSVKAVVAVCVLAAVTACSRAPVEPAPAAATLAVPTAPLTIEPVYTGKFK